MLPLPSKGLPSKGLASCDDEPRVEELHLADVMRELQERNCEVAQLNQLAEELVLQKADQAVIIDEHEAVIASLQRRMVERPQVALGGRVAAAPGGKLDVARTLLVYVAGAAMLAYVSFSRTL